MARSCYSRRLNRPPISGHGSETAAVCEYKSRHELSRLCFPTVFGKKSSVHSVHSNVISTGATPDENSAITMEQKCKTQKWELLKSGVRSGFLFTVLFVL